MAKNNIDDVKKNWEELNKINEHFDNVEKIVNK